MGSAVPRAAVIADSDSRWRWAALTARKIAPGHALDARLLSCATTPAPRQIEDAGVLPDTSRVVTVAEALADPAVAEADLLVLGTLGGTALALLHSLGAAWDGGSRRPVVITGYAGAVYENLVDGLLLRAGADLVLANSPHDARRFREAYRGAGVDEECVVEAGLPFLGGPRYDPSAVARGERPFTVCFAVQPTVPASPAARAGLVEKLRRHALRHPERQVLIKPRTRAGETGTRPERHAFRDLFEALGDRPPNLGLAEGSMAEVLNRTDLLVTLSSTAAFEAMQRGIPTAILTDYGIREAHGNHFFVSSGALASFAQLDEGLVPRPGYSWTTEHGIGQRDPFGPARARVAQLRTRAALPRVRPFYTPQNAPDYLEGLLGRHGLGLSGQPLPDGQAGRAGSGAMRRLIQRGAGGLYRVGTTRVAPVIRRLAEGAPQG
ncbi:glycosyltransferase [Streptomyces sp. DSM 44917]|uniref:Glycosyltransferase n=1 Tax=Streptomyces boetiae TaxID=3075541 RepID=A0ABU2LGX6_9ACTN|nr:glycosyltransferase [Streptomyces sp. DSM 44917]MDT0310498.1 glycosyltransferase [Streptomyces sp. DSM 44917]